MFRLPWQKDSAAAPAEASQRTAPSTDAADAAEEGSSVPTIHVARQPRFDCQSSVMGYELLFRSSAENRFSASDVEAASGITIEQSTSAFGFDQLVGDRKAFVNLSRGAVEWLLPHAPR